MATLDDVVQQSALHRKQDADSAAAKREKEISQNVGKTGLDTITSLFGMAASWKSPQATAKAGISFAMSAVKFAFALSARFGGATTSQDGPSLGAASSAPANLPQAPTGPQMTGTMG